MASRLVLELEVLLKGTLRAIEVNGVEADLTHRTSHSSRSGT